MKNFQIHSVLSAFARFTAKSILVLLVAVASIASSQAQVIQMDASWKCFPLPTPSTPAPYPSNASFGNPSGAWTTVGYADGSWTTPVTIAAPAAGSPSNRIWTQQTTPQVWAACFRKTFTLTTVNPASYHSLQILTDNDGDVWVNGQFLGHTHWPTVNTFCIPSNWLNVGNNVIAIKVSEYTNNATWASVLATFNQQPNAAIAGNTVICAGSPTTLTASGGTSYLWSNNATTPTLTVSTAGTYSVTATNAAGCKATASTTVAVSPLPVATISGNTSICTGTSTTLTASGGGTYLWSNNATTPSISTSTAGVYSVTVTNAAGCKATTSVTVTVKPAPVVTITGNTSICAGTSTTLTATGGGTYQWSNNATTAAITVSAAGTYTVTVTGANGCTTVKSVTVSALSSPVISLVSQNVICKGNVNIVSIDINVTGGTAPYTYSWTNGAITQDLVNVVGNVASYCVLVTDAKGCQAKRCFECISPCSTNPTVIISPILTLTTTNTDKPQNEADVKKGNEVANNEAGHGEVSNGNLSNGEVSNNAVSNESVSNNTVESAKTDVAKKADVKKAEIKQAKSVGAKILGAILGNSLFNYLNQKLSAPKSLPQLR